MMLSDDDIIQKARECGLPSVWGNSGCEPAIRFAREIERMRDAPEYTFTNEELAAGIEVTRHNIRHAYPGPVKEAFEKHLYFLLDRQRDRAAAPKEDK